MNIFNFVYKIENLFHVFHFYIKVYIMKPIIIYNSQLTKCFELDGLVIYPFVFITTCKEETLPSVIKHEMVHVKQVKREGFCMFYYNTIKFIVKSLINGKGLNYAITEGPYEVEAYRDQELKINKEDIELSDWDGPLTDYEFKKHGYEGKKHIGSCTRGHSKCHRNKSKIYNTIKI